MEQKASEPAAPEELITLGSVPDLPDLLDLTPGELALFVAGLGEPAYRSRQLFSWLHARAARSFAEMTNLPASLRTRLQEQARIGQPEVALEQKDSRTGTRKFLLKLVDGTTIEAVAMPYKHGISACISTQVGCRMGCRFCASTLNGLLRNLAVGEMVGQLLAIASALSEGQRVASVVLMGSGEPMENYDNVIKAIRLVHEREGMNIGLRHITLSTSGLVPQMRRLATEGLPINLAVSLHAPNNALRSELMPVNRIFALADVVAAAQDYAEITGRRVTYEYLLLDGVNDSDQHADQLAELLHGQLAHVNLIPYNPVDERPYRRPSRARVEGFLERLTSAGISATTRRTMGDEIDAACGQLRNRNLRPSAPVFRPGLLPPPLRPARRDGPPGGGARS